MKNIYVILAIVVAGLFTFDCAAKADSFSDLNSAGAGPSNYAVLGLGGGEVDLSLVTVNGNIGIGAGGTIDNMAPSKINGNVFEATAGQYSGPGHLNGTITVNPTLLSTNVSGAIAAANDASTATVTQTFGSIGSATTITGAAGLNVIDVNGNINLNNANLTLAGPSNAFFIINVSGNMSLVGNASLVTGTGVSESNVLYNFTSTSASINTHVGDVVDGILLADGSKSSMTLDGTFNGELIGNAITLMSGAVVNAPPPTVPEPGSLFLMGTGAVLVGFVGVARRRRISRTDI